METKELQLSLDERVTAFKKADWIGSLPLQCITVESINNRLVKSDSVDVCKYIPGGTQHNDVDLNTT
jgi:hypothetical protein